MNQALGTNDAVSIAVEKYSDMIRRICFLYLRNDADVEDVFQDVFLSYFLHSHLLQSEEHRKAWLCKVAYNKCKDICKSSWRKRVTSLEEEDIPYENEDQRDLVRAVLELPAEERAIIHFHYYEGRTIPEVAKIIGKNTNTIYTILRRAKSNLKKKVGEL